MSWVGGMLASFYLSSDDPVVGIFDKLQWRVAKAEAAQALKEPSPVTSAANQDVVYVRDILWKEMGSP